jgi:thiol-disulfide isomerase/thioredoxin
LIVVTGLAIIASGLRADEPKTPAEKLAAIQQQHKEAEAAYRKAVEPLKDDEEGQKKYQEIYAGYDKGQGERFLAAVEIAKADPKADVALPALEWVLTIPRSYYLPAGLAAMQEVTKHHATNPKVGKLVAWVGYYPPYEQGYPKEAAAAWAMIEAVAKTNPDKTVRAQAVLATALKAKRAYDATAYKNSPDAEKLAGDAEAAFEAVVKEYGECPRLARENLGTVGEFANEALFELRNLRVGKVAPDIEGEGVDGKKFKLSDHRGRVVAVVFWASWCGPCMREVPHEREMTEHLKGRPFTIVGVNGDDKREKAAEVMAAEKMVWPSFWNGTGGPDGGIAKAWNVRSWPTVYVLDATGVIRYKGLRGKDLEEKVTLLLDEMKAKK